MKKLALTLIITALTTGALYAPAFAATTVTYNGGHIYQTQQGKPGTIKLDITNIDSQQNVKMTDTELMSYLDADGTVDKTVYTNEVGKTFSIRSIVQDLNSKGGVPVYTASSMPVLTAKTTLNTFLAFWKGTDVTQATYNLKSDANGLIAPGTNEKINKSGKYLFIVHDSGAIDDSPVSILCVNVGGAATTTTNTSTATSTATANTAATTNTATTATTAPTPAPVAKVTGWSKTNGTWFYLNTDGTMKTGWLNDGGAWYFLDGSGAMKTGWIQDNGTWYYLNANGSMASNTTIDGYTLDASGAWIK
jgi:hypothetical protein